MDEPTIYDYIVSLFNPEKRIEFQRKIPGESGQIEEMQIAVESKRKKNRLRLIFGCVLAIFAQFLLEPELRFPLIASALYVAAGLLIWKAGKKEVRTSIARTLEPFEIKARLPFLMFSIISQVITFLLFKGNRFNNANLGFWIAGIISMTLAFWQPKKKVGMEKRAASKNALFITAFAVTIFIVVVFRVYQINQVPAEMYSDHAEKILDVIDIFEGKYSVFFQRNTGREPLQFYVTALIIQLFNTGFSFLSLKLGTIIFGLLTLPFIYLIVRDEWGEWSGLAAFFTAGVAYWPNVISRVALRYALYPLFAAPALYFFIKGLSKRNINFLLISGICIGFGLLGYSSFRITPVLIAVLMTIYAALYRKQQPFMQRIIPLFIIGIVAFSVFIPLFRYWYDHPGSFSYRMLTRMLPVEKPYDAPAFVILLKNLVSSFLMPLWNNGHIWVHSIPNRPALDFISGAFYFIGLVTLIKKIFTKRDFFAISLVLSILVFMLPSILSLTYPGENPSLNRSAAAYIPIFIISGYGFFLLIENFNHLVIAKIKKAVSVALVILFAGWIAFNNFQLVFGEYKNQFQQNAWNSSEIGTTIRAFLDEQENQGSAYVIPYPHWVDTRLVAINAGQPGKDFALWREDIENREYSADNYIFIYKPEDSETEKALEEKFPAGESSTFYSSVQGKDFIIYTVVNE